MSEDVSLSIGRKTVIGKSYAELPQNGNDAGNILLANFSEACKEKSKEKIYFPSGIECSKIGELKFLCYLEEHKNCRTEIERTYVEKQKLYVLEFTVFGALLLFIVHSIYFDNTKGDMINNVFLVSPLVFFLASVIYTESHIRILENARYIHFNIKPKMESILCACPDDQLLCWEQHLYDKRRIDFHHLHCLMYCEYVLDFVCPTSIIFFWCLWSYTDFFGRAYHDIFHWKEFVFVVIYVVLFIVLFRIKSNFSKQYGKICEQI